jgi:hypothetical protein
MLPPQPFAAMAAPPAAAPASPAVAPSSHSKQEESHYRHYVHERVREKSVRAASEPPTIEKAAPAQPTPQPNLPTMTYGAFPIGMPTTAIPVAYAIPTYPIPPPPPNPTAPGSAAPKSKSTKTMPRSHTKKAFTSLMR